MDGLQDDITLLPAPSLLDEAAKLIARANKWKARENAMLERIRRPYAEYKKAHPEGDLCQRCASIDWSLLLPSDASYYCEYYRSLKLFAVPESSQELRASTCSLCRLLAIDQEFGENPVRSLAVGCARYESWFPYYKDSLDLHYMLDWRNHATCIKLPLAHGEISSYSTSYGLREYILQGACASTQSYALRRVTPELIDYDILRRWLTHCKGHRATKCDSTFALSIPGLRVFDCNADRVVAAPEDINFQYVALSYVWGGTQAPGEDQAALPLTIRDAITVTLELGYVYLWVDQLCIHQSDESHKQAQIKLMGRIYAEAELVIIAAAGSSSHYGLPGVSTTPRQAQRILQLDKDFDLIQIIDAHHELEKSTWATRAWTHQEGYLAARRLVFTDEEVLCECEHGFWQESVKRPGMEHHDSYVRSNFSGFSRVDTLGLRQRVCDLIRNYSARKLSFDGDILNACIGMLEKLVDHHFWGMVILPNYDSTVRPYLCLDWRSKHPGKRRTSFPTWSWVATTGPKYMSIWGYCEEPDFVAEIFTADGRWLTPLSQPESRYEPLPEDSGPTLRLTGLFYTAFLSANGEPSKVKKHGGNHSKLPKTPFVIFEHASVDDGDLEIVIELRSDTELTESTADSTVKAVLVERSSKLNFNWQDDEYQGVSSNHPVFIILQAVGDHYRRIGVTGDLCWIIDKKTGLRKEETSGFVAPHLSCRGDEEVLYIA